MPGGWRIGFVGKAEDIWWVFILRAVRGGGRGLRPLQLLAIPLQAFLALLIVRWFCTNIAWEGKRSCCDSLAVIGRCWVERVRLYLSSHHWLPGSPPLDTLVRNVQGSSRERAFTASGWGYLWRAGGGRPAIFLIPIPWTVRWFTRWLICKLRLLSAAKRMPRVGAFDLLHRLPLCQSLSKRQSLQIN